TFMQFSDGVNFLADGIGREIFEGLCADGGRGSEEGDDTIVWITTRVEVLKRLYDSLITQSGVQFSFHTQVVGIEKSSDSRVTHTICSAKSGLFAVEAGVFIDCTGDADLAALAGAQCEKGDPEGNMMPGTLCSLWADVDWDAVHRDGRWAQSVLQSVIEAGGFPVPDKHLPGMARVGEHLGGGNIGHTFGVDGTDEVSLTEALITGRKLMLDYERFYKKHMTGYEKMELVMTGSLLGIRESRRVTGDYVLCLDDFKTRAVFDDEIGRYCYPVDIHASKPDSAQFAAFEKEFESLRYGPGESYGIPYRALIPQGLDNVLVAGRCISSDRYIQGSVRVMPGCFITGQAAGVAAALAAKRTDANTRAISIEELQGKLRDMGAYLPNFHAR
ncbi:MAG: FAD-dependent oxidoreductase, partial [Armatimonadota bacterium]